MDAKLTPATSTENDEEIIDLTEVIAMGTPIASPHNSSVSGKEKAITTPQKDMQANPPKNMTSPKSYMAAGNQPTKADTAPHTISPSTLSQHQDSAAYPYAVSTPQESTANISDAANNSLTELLKNAVSDVFDAKMASLGGDNFAEHFGSLKQRFGDVEQTVITIGMRFNDIEQRVNTFSQQITQNNARFASMEEKLHTISEVLAQQTDVTPSVNVLLALEQRCSTLEKRLERLEKVISTQLDARVAQTVARILREEITALLAHAE